METLRTKKQKLLHMLFITFNAYIIVSVINGIRNMSLPEYLEKYEYTINIFDIEKSFEH